MLFFSFHHCPLPPSPPPPIHVGPTSLRFLSLHSSSPSSHVVPLAAIATVASAKVIDGQKEAKKIKDEIKAEVSRMREALGVIPGLAVILVGDREHSATYVRRKKEACEYVGINSLEARLPKDSTEEEVLNYITGYNDDPSVHGILVQLPLPSEYYHLLLTDQKGFFTENNEYVYKEIYGVGLSNPVFIKPQDGTKWKVHWTKLNDELMSEENVMNAVRIEKDVDGFHPLNIGRLAMRDRETLFIPCTPKGCIELLHRSDVSIKGKRAVVIGRSNIVGMLAALLLQVISHWATDLHHVSTAPFGLCTSHAHLVWCLIDLSQIIHCSIGASACANVSRTENWPGSP